MFFPRIVKRIPEPELMNSYEQAVAYSDADFSASDEIVIKRIEEEANVHGLSMVDQRIIDIGCGPGNIAERLAIRWPQAQVIGIDGSKEMLLLAEARKRELSAKADLDNLSYIDLELSRVQDYFISNEKKADVLVSNSVLHHIHEPHSFWEALKILGKSECLTFHRDLRRPATSKHVMHLQKKYLSEAPDILISDYLASLYAAFNLKEVKLQLFKSGLSNLRVYEVGDRYLEIVGIMA